MTKYPTLHVENFARIRKADIELAPLTLFVGDNNSGKSYLSSLIWGINLLANYESPLWGWLSTDKEFGLLELIERFIDSPESLKNEFCEKSWSIDKKTHESIVSDINSSLNRILPELTEYVFGTEINIGEFFLEIPYDDELVLTAATRDFSANRPGADRDRFLVCSFSRGNKKASAWERFYDLDNEGEGDSIEYYLPQLFLSAFLSPSTFFPASRTGFLLTYPSLLQESVERRFNHARQIVSLIDYQLTSPQVSFLQMLIGLSKNVKKDRSGYLESLADFAERFLVHGRISLNDIPASQFFYRPEEVDEEIPMYLASGVVTENAPLLACLKYGSIGDRCIIEEPEMSLHPELQWRMAQVLVRLANSIDFVLATTHSDTIIQHVNNMIKLSNRKDGKQLAAENGYDEEDIVSSDKVRMYQFDVDPKSHLTDVTALECGKNGFAVPTFGKTLRKMRNDIWAFRIDVEEESTPAPKESKPKRKKKGS